MAAGSIAASSSARRQAVSVVITDLQMTQLGAAGGNGADAKEGGGGGMGAGGAVFVRGGASVTLENVSLLNNSAVGGRGARLA